MVLGCAVIVPIAFASAVGGMQRAIRAIFIQSACYVLKLLS